MSVPRSYSGLSGFVKNIKNMKNMKEWSKKWYAITRHKPVCLNFERRKTIVGAVNHQWQCDLCNIQNINADNLDVKRGFESSILKRKKKGIQTDRGTEFFNRGLQVWFKQKRIKDFASHNYDKASIAERILRTLKSRMWHYFTWHNTRRYVGCLAKLIKSYNNSFHCSIDMTPIKGSKTKRKQNIILKWLYSRGVLKPHPKFKLNDMVRVAHYRKTFDKGYFPN